MSDLAISRPAPSASGTFTNTPFLHIVLYAREQKLDGTIDFVAPDQTTTASLVFIEGEPAKARLSVPVAYFGAVLRDLGAVTDQDLSRSLSSLQAEKASGHSLHGELLLRRRLIDQSQLSIALREQMARKLRRVAVMPSGTVYGFCAGFDVCPMLWDILRDNPPEAHVKAGLARVESLPLRLSMTADVSRLGLGDKERAAAEFLRARPARVAELSAGGLDETESKLLAYLLLATRQLEVATPANDGAEASGAAPREAGESPEAAPDGRSTLGGAMPSALPPPSLRLAPVYVHRWIEIVAQLRRMERADHFQVLGVGRDASRDEIEAAFVELAKKWHPDRLPPALAPVGEPIGGARRRRFAKERRDNQHEQGVRQHGDLSRRLRRGSEPQSSEHGRRRLGFPPRMGLRTARVPREAQARRGR